MVETVKKSNNTKIAVIGAGVSGIAAAYYLLKQGYTVDLFEKSSKIGGRMGAEKLDGKILAIGGKNIGIRARLFREFARSNGNPEFEYFGTSWSREIDGKLIEFNNNNKLLTYLKLIKLFGLKDLLKLYRLMLLLQFDKENYYLDGPSFKKISEKYDDKPISAYFSKKFCNNFLRLLIVRMNGTEPDNFYLGNFCANLGMVKFSKQLEQFAGNGMYELLKTFEKSKNLNIHTNNSVRNLSVKEDTIIEIVVKNKQDIKKYCYRGVILASTAKKTAILFQKMNPDISSLLNKIVYNPVGIAIVKYNKPVFTKERRSISFDDSKILSNAGVYGIHDMDIIRYTFSGKTAMKEITKNLDTEELISEAERILNRYCKNSIKKERGEYLYRYFEDGLCSHAPYHHIIMEQINNLIDDKKIELTGDYVKGNSLEACFYSSKRAAMNLHKKLIVMNVSV